MDVTYLDHNASTPIADEVLKDFFQLFKKCTGNPSSVHRVGRENRRLIYDATEVISDYISCDPQAIYWTSGASEANSWALYSAAQCVLQTKKQNPCFVISAIEHDSTLLAVQSLSQLFGLKVIWLKALPSGEIDLNALGQTLHLTPCDLVSIVMVNNETGVIQPIEKVSELCEKFSVPLHLDCVQALGKVPVSIQKLKCTYATFSGHKIGAPKGVGFLVVQGKGRVLWPIIYGKQQKTLRGGTENSFGISFLGKIIQAMSQNQFQPFPEHLKVWQRDFEAELKRLIPGTVIHGETKSRIHNTSFVGFHQTDGDGILMNLDLEGICASSGSACTSGSLDPSHVLLAMGCEKQLARSSVRFSSGRINKWVDFERVLHVLPLIVERVRKAKQ